MRYYDLYTDSANLCDIHSDEIVLGTYFVEDGKTWEIIEIDMANMRLTIDEVEDKCVKS